MGGVRYTSASGGAAESPAGRIVNFVGFPISAQTDSNAIAVCNYVWDATANEWQPMLQPATT